MNMILDYVYRLLLHPVEALYDITSGERLKESTAIWAFVVLLLTLSSFSAGPGIVTEYIGAVIFMGSMLLIHSALIDYISGFLGGRGTARGITAGFMCASLPYAFSVFFILLGQFGFEMFNGLAGALIGLWSFILDVIAIRVNYGFTKGKAFFVGVLPFLIAGIFTFALIVIGAVAALSGLANMQEIEGVINSI